MSQRTYKQFFYGKSIPKTNTKSRPSKWIPNTFIDTYNAQTGIFRSRRKYGADGYMIKDLDVSDNHRPYDHVHDYNAGRRSVRNPTKKEKYEFYRAKKKRRSLMIDYENYDFDEDDLVFLDQIKRDCENLNEVILQYNGKSFVIDPHGEKIEVYAYGETLGFYEDFDDLFLNHKIDGIPLTVLIKQLDFGE